METLVWNINPHQHKSISVVIITTDLLPAENEEDGPKKRLLVLSHQLALNGVPAIYQECIPLYADIDDDQPCIVGFDIFQKLANFKFPPWVETHQWEPKIDGTISKSFLDDLQRATNLFITYRYQNIKPIYFFTFIYLQCHDVLDSDIILQPVPIYSDHSIFFRYYIVGQLRTIVMKGILPTKDTFILIPPYEHPLYVENLSFNTVYLTTIDKEHIEMDFTDREYILLMDPPSSLFKLYPYKNMTDEPTVTETFFERTNIEFFDLDFNELTMFFEGKEPRRQIDELTFDEVPISAIIDEIVEKAEDRESLDLIIRPYGVLPTPPVDLILPSQPFLSSLLADILPPSCIVPQCALRIISFIPTVGRHTGVPSVRIKVDGRVRQVPANTLFDQWEANRFQPTGDPKDTKYIAFIVDNCVDESDALSYLAELSSCYAQYGLGKLEPDPNSPHPIFVDAHNLIQELEETYPEDSIKEFRQNLPTAIVIHPLKFDVAADGKAIVTFVSSSVVKYHEMPMIRSDALLIYSRIRRFKPTPYGQLEIGSSAFASLYFGFRIEPAFQIEEETVSIHCAWDPITKLSAWMDSRGSTFHIYARPMEIAELRQVFANINSELKGVAASLTIAVLAEGITEELYNEVASEDGTNVTLVSIFPAPAVQAVFNSPFDDDVVVFADPERLYDAPIDGYIPPLASCFVIPHRLPAYGVSIFDHRSDSDKDALFETARILSHLSWMSAAPTPARRVHSLPTHVLALLRRTKKDAVVTSRLEFLPTKFV